MHGFAILNSGVPRIPACIYVCTHMPDSIAIPAEGAGGYIYKGRRRDSVASHRFRMPLRSIIEVLILRFSITPPLKNKVCLLLSRQDLSEHKNASKLLFFTDVNEHAYFEHFR